MLFSKHAVSDKRKIYQKTRSKQIIKQVKIENNFK